MVGQTPFDYRVPCDDYAGLHAAGDLCTVPAAQLRKQAAKYADATAFPGCLGLALALQRAADAREREGMRA
ncbi:MAG: hypothetical protein HPY55_16160 [Firmicutes bacterium]|nr:hypothetical protein [Bacillota bacterium]